MRRRDALIALGATLVGTSSRAGATPVPTGRYRELAHGVDPAAPEPMEHGGAARAGRLVAEVPAREPRLAWSRDSDVSSRARPREPIVDAAGTIVVGTAQGISVLDVEGALRFDVAIGPIDGSPALLPGDGVVAIARGGRALVLSRRDGTVRAQAELGCGVSEPPLVLDDGSIVVAGTDRSLRRLDPRLRERWRATLPGGTGKAPTRDGDRVAVVAGEDLVLVDLEGAIDRVIPLGGRAHGPASRADDGRLWIPLVEGELVVVEDRWRVGRRVSLGGRMGTAERIAIARDGTLRVPLRARGLVALGLEGREMWSAAAVNGHAFDFPARVDPRGVTLVADRGPYLRAIEIDGRERWSVRLPVHVMSGAVVTRDGAVVCVGMEGSVFVLR